MSYSRYAGRAAAALLLAVLVGLGMPAAASSKSIVGTARNDVLRGTGGADVIDGKGGNDTIYGLAGDDRLLGGPGNDTIYGGPGADHIVCGPGRDTVYADASDAVAKDCEVVKGLPPKALPPPPPPLATAGHYVGTTSQGHRIGFDVGPDGTTVSGLTFRGDAQCEGVKIFNFPVTFGSLQVSAPGAFTSPVPTSSVVLGGSVTGSFDATHAASGTLQIDFLPLIPSTTCSTGPITWTAQPTPVLLLPGHYAGVAPNLDNGVRESVTFDVADDGRTVKNLHIDYIAACQPSNYWRGSLDWAGPFTVQSDRTLSADATNSAIGTTISLTMSFDAAGSLTGTTAIHVSTDQAGGHYECDTGKATWQGGLQT